MNENTDSTLLQQLGKLLDKMRPPSAADVINPAKEFNSLIQLRHWYFKVSTLTSLQHPACEKMLLHTDINCVSDIDKF